MACLDGTDAFTSIENHATRAGIPEMVVFGETLTAVRRIVSNRQGDVFEANAWWQELVTRARRIDSPWDLATVWAALPRLRQMAWSIRFKRGIELRECHAELLVSTLCVLKSINLRASDIGDVLVRAAAAPVWEYLRSGNSVISYAFEDIDAFSTESADGIVPDVSFDFVVDAIKNPPTTKRLEGERLGALADKLGLEAAIRRVEERIFETDSMDFVEVFDIPEMIDLSTAAKALRISMGTAYKRIKDRSFPCAVLRRDGIYRVPTMSLAIAMDIDPTAIDPLDFLRGARFSARHDWR